MVVGINLFLLLTFISLVFGAARFVQEGYIKLTEKPLTLIYLGHHSEFSQTFVNPKNKEYFKTFSELDAPNLSFSALGKVEQHLKGATQGDSLSVASLSWPKLFLGRYFTLG
ncbi:hypothetical protein F9L16_23850 [Agarivorans sp. B2Z047]|uniref:hypothetical protein n=1 Tax=Agarivorans sp. B2Z047 TaxID=2652721 RepID=UPI00128C4310|nr:hypothetical protein [Agarivorans sp. B2Z047]MPW31984.1 hypothetical protein [Agarivorans sp. B2Z047]